MAANVGKWLKYAQAKLAHAIDSSNAELDELEAEQAARVADEPWLASDDPVPTYDEARARIEAETEAAAKPDPSVAEARRELDRQAEESKARLEAIRKELGVDPPA